MTTTPAAPAASRQAAVDAALLVLKSMGLSLDDLTAVPSNRPPVPTFAEYVPVVAATVTPGTLRAYRPYWKRTVEQWGGRHLDEPTPSEIKQLVASVKANAVPRRNSRGGRHAAENLISALRCLYLRAVDDGLIDEKDNPARKVDKPRRLQSTRRALEDARLAEINQVAATTGDDPELDTLILRLHTETACRRAGALALRPRDLDREHCLVLLREKGETFRWQPVSPTLMAALVQHAEERHAPPDGQLLRYRDGRQITERRYDGLWVRIGRELPWVRTQDVSTHWIRHTTLTWVEALGVPWTRNWDAAVAGSYPFHPQLISLAEQEWAKLAGFQEVRSTIKIFAATVYTLAQRGQRGEWAPLLIGPGDLPLSDSAVREAIIGSGLISDTRTQANYRSIASADIVSADGQTGAARMLDREREGTSAAVNPRAAERAATCLFLCSIVGSRGAGRQGASEPELKAAMFVPSQSFGLADADSVLVQLKDIDGGGLASAEPIPGRGGQPPRLFLSTRQTLRMLLRAARGTIGDEERDAELWRAAQRLSPTGPFKKVIHVEYDPARPAREVLETAGIDDARATRLVVLDPRQFSLLNGVDRETRAAIRAALGIGPDRLPVQWASSAVFAVCNTQRRGTARGAAVTYLAWDRLCELTDVTADEDMAEQARDERTQAKRNFESAARRAYQHVIYLDAGDEAAGEPRIERLISFEQENQTALDGNTVWKALAEAGKAFQAGAFSGRALIHNLRDDDYGRPLDEVRDLFWSAPRMPLLAGGDADLQLGIFQALSEGAVRLVGADGTERHVMSAAEISLGLSSLRLAKPLPPEPSGETSDQGSASTSGGTGEGGTSGPAGSDGNGDRPTDGETGPALERQVTFSLRTSLSADASRDALYALLNELADKVDDGAASYAEVMVRIRVADTAADGIASLVRSAGGNPDIREVLVSTSERLRPWRRCRGRSVRGSNNARTPPSDADIRAWCGNLKGPGVQLANTG